MTTLFGGRHRRSRRGTRIAIAVAAGAVAVAAAATALPRADATSPYPTSPNSTSASSTSPPPAPVAPAGPKLTVRQATSQSASASDRSAPLVVTNVRAGSGSVASVKIKYGPRDATTPTWTDNLPVVAGQATYQHTATGLAQLRNGEEYRFVAEVCNTAGLCSTSSTLLFTPYTTPVKPATPGLTVYQPGSSAANGSDRHAPFLIGGVHANSGSLASVTVYSGPSSVPASGLSWTDDISITMIMDGRATVKGTDYELYDAYAYGGGHLLNAREYQFVAQVCNTAGLCSRSTPVLFTPYGLPQPPRPTVSVSGLSYRISWGTVNQNGYRGTPTCKIYLVDVAGGTAKALATADPTLAGSFTGVGSPGTFKARYECSWTSGRGGAVEDSDPFTVR